MLVRIHLGFVRGTATVLIGRLGRSELIVRLASPFPQKTDARGRIFFLFHDFFKNFRIRNEINIDKKRMSVVLINYS